MKERVFKKRFGANQVQYITGLEQKIFSVTYPELTELSTSGQERRRLQKAMVGFSGGGWWRGTRSEPPRRGGAAGARQSRVRRRALRADAPSVGTTRGKPVQYTYIHNNHAYALANLILRRTEHHLARRLSEAKDIRTKIIHSLYYVI